MDRRVDPRLELQLPCHLPALRGRSRVLVGVTANISRGGLLVLWDPKEGGKIPKLGELIDLEVELPANHAYGRKCLYCQATAVRIASVDGGRTTVAFQIHQMKFRNSGSSRKERIENVEEFEHLLM
ncbi:MAG: PilZ domain-containing protein [Bryobacterales bacterium]|nr:PilZ domain-containing protein [Bryobacteraceae bacterium]MDW8129929.1 PilZ domain-containing protein [Bryobacterales bacterium]